MKEAKTLLQLVVVAVIEIESHLPTNAIHYTGSQSTKKKLQK